jgi:hypothetical protein
MNWRTSLVLACLGLCLASVVAMFQSIPGYLDSDYYYDGGVQLAQGHGFSEPYLWNYLDDPQGIPHPSHTYWMPLASLIAAVGMWVTGHTDYAAGRLGFLAIAAAVPVLAASLSWELSARREFALVSGLLAVFSIYYVPFLPVPDNYGVYLVLGALFFLTLSRRHNALYLVLGLLGGFMTLARSDGVLWLVMACIAAVLNDVSPVPIAESNAPTPSNASGFLPRLRRVAIRIALAVGAYSLVMAPWGFRNYTIYGALLAPGGGRLLWLTSYDETFLYPASQLTFTRWLAQGLPSIALARITALRWNLLNAFAAQGGIFLLPFVVTGAWILRRDIRIQIGILAWLALLFTMSVVFPFAGARGGFFHAGSSLQCLWWALAPLGLESAVAAARKRKMLTSQAFKIFRIALVGIAVVMSAVILIIRVLPGWGEGEQAYVEIEAFLERNGAQPGEIVMVRNPPGYHIMTGRPAIVVPYAGADEMLAAARRYEVKYLVIENAGAAGPIKTVYEDVHNEAFELLGELDGARIFRIRP